MKYVSATFTAVGLILVAFLPLVSGQLELTKPPKEKELENFNPLFGKYGPDPRYGFFAAGFFEFFGDRFEYLYITDVLDDIPLEEKIQKGELRYFPSYIELTYPNGHKGYYFRTEKDGYKVLWEWNSYQEMKGSKDIIDPGKILYEQNKKK